MVEIKNVRWLCLALLLALYVNNVFAAAGYIVQGATLTSVANAFGGPDNFVVSATCGTGICQGQNITFKLEEVALEPILARAYSTALTAFVSGSKVNIWSKDGACAGATQIQVYK